MKNKKVSPKAYYPKVSYPTLALLFFCLIGFFLNFYFTHIGTYNEFTGGVLSVFFLYLAFTPLHEASHGNIFYSGHRWKKQLNVIIGNISGTFLFAPYPAFLKLHMTHHAFVNDHKKDPDHWVKGNNFFSTLLRLLTLYGRYYQFYLSRTGWKGVRIVILYNSAFLLLGIGLSYLFSFSLFLKLWIVPLIIALVLIGTSFDLIPHYPHGDRSRYGNAKTIRSKILNWVMLYHNYHIVHHLYPKIPFYQYEAYYKDSNLEKVIIENKKYL